MEANSPEWFHAMSDAMKKRDHALMMQSRWNKKVAEAEQLVYELTQNVNKEDVPDEPTPV
jgi:hypothetical protein